MNFLSSFAVVGLVILAFMFLLWLISLAIKNSSIVDIYWGFGFVLAAWAFFLLTSSDFLNRKILLVSLTSIWGLRLTIHVLLRNWGKAEDFRYQKWRTESGRIWWIKSFFQVYLLQGLLMWIISLPLLAGQFFQNKTQFGFFDYFGILFWIVGFFFESIGDAQLTLFKKNPLNHGKVLSSGVWRFSRHPNYFGDSAQWWGYYLIAASAGGWWTIFSPIIMTLFLIKVSGVVLLEKTLIKTKPGYSEYAESTSAFIPWFPRKK
jgi:steroid 5-alpha reductase family enzyme